MELRRLLKAVILVIITSSCDISRTDEQNNFTDITTSLDSFEQNNRLYFREMIVKYHLNSDYSDSVSLLIVNLFDIIDETTEDLLIKSGGYDRKTGALIGGNKKGLSKQVITENNMLWKLEKKLKQVEKLINLNPSEANKLTIKELERNLYIFNSEHWKADLEVATIGKIYLDLMIVQNSLLITETTYFEKHRTENQTTN